MNSRVDPNHPIFTQKYIYTSPMDEMISVIGSG